MAVELSFYRILPVQAGKYVDVFPAMSRHKRPSTTKRYLKTLGIEQVRKALERLFHPRGTKVVKFKKPRLIGRSKKRSENKNAV